MRNDFFLLTVIALQSTVVHASGALECPSHVVVQQEAREVPKGWQAFEPSRKHPLISVEFSEGEPIHQVTLLPTEEQGDSVAIWTFTPSAEGYWISCGYNSTSMVLSRKLPDRTTSCLVEYDKDFSTPLPKSIHCTVGTGVE